MRQRFLSLIHQTAVDKRRVVIQSQENQDSQHSDPKEKINQEEQAKILDEQKVNDQSSESEVSQDDQNDHPKSRQLGIVESEILQNGGLPFKLDSALKTDKQRYLSDIDRKLAVFYHPLFLEVCDAWLGLMACDAKDGMLNFVLFLEVNLRMQRALLAKFDLSNAFVSGLKDWVKEVGDCLQMSNLYKQVDGNVLASVQMEGQSLYNFIIKRLPFKSAISEQDYQIFFDTQKQNKDLYKYLGVRVGGEVWSKFLFDLCFSWCQYLDIELFVYFLFSLFMQVSNGLTFKDSILSQLQDIQLLPNQFLTDFEQQVQLFSRYKRKNLRYYRAWCEWNYLRIEDIGESILSKVIDIFPEEQYINFFNNILSTRGESIVQVFSKAMDVVNKEITHQAQVIPQVKTTEPSKIEISQNNDLNKRTDNRVNYSSAQMGYNVYMEYSQPLVPDLFIITYNEQENAFILERKVKMPILGQKIQILGKTGTQRRQETQKYTQDKKDVYLYYVSNQPSNEQKKEVIDNLHKAPKLPLVARQKSEKKSLDEQVIIKKTTQQRGRSVNNSFSNATSSIKQQSLVPNFLEENEQFSFIDQLNQSSMDCGANTQYQYHTTHKTWDDFSRDIGSRRRLLKSDVPKEVLQRDFNVKEFEKIISMKDYPQQLGRINKRGTQPATFHKYSEQQNEFRQSSPLENKQIAEIMSKTNYLKLESVQELPAEHNQRTDNDFLLASSLQQMANDTNGLDKLQYTKNLTSDNQRQQQQDVLQSHLSKRSNEYSLHNVALTYEQWDSLQQNKHLWEPVLSLEEAKLLRQDDNKFYHILQLLKLKFNQEHKSDYLKQLRLDFNYASRRDEMGGVISLVDQERFHQRVEKLLNRDRRRKERRKAKGKKLKIIIKSKNIKSQFKNKKTRLAYKEMFISPLQQ